MIERILLYIIVVLCSIIAGISSMAVIKFVDDTPMRPRSAYEHTLFKGGYYGNRNR